MKRQPLGLPSLRRDAPDVALVQRQAMNEVDEGAILRPHGKMIVKATASGVDLATDLLIWPGNEERIAFGGRMIDDAGPVRGPVEFGDAGEVRLRRSAHRRNCPTGIDGTAGHARPQRDERSVRREPDGSSCGIPQLTDAAAGEVVDLLRAHLA